MAYIATAIFQKIFRVDLVNGGHDSPFTATRQEPHKKIKGLQLCDKHVIPSFVVNWEIWEFEIL